MFITLALIFLAAFASSFIGSLVGGGSIIITGVLLAMGIPPTTIIGSRRAAAIGGNLGAWIIYHKEKKVDYRLALILLAFSLIGVFIGVELLTFLEQYELKYIIASVLFVLLIITFLKNQKGKPGAPKPPSMLRTLVGGLGATLSAIVNNISGAGGGMVLAYTLLLVHGQKLLHVAGTSKFMLLVSNIVAATVFIYKGYVDWSIAPAMLLGHFIGGWFGAEFYLQRSESILQWVFYVVALLLISKVLFF